MFSLFYKQIPEPGRKTLLFQLPPTTFNLLQSSLYKCFYESAGFAKRENDDITAEHRLRLNRERTAVDRECRGVKVGGFYKNCGYDTLLR